MIKIVCVGKIKDSFYQDAVNEYIKRLKIFTKIDIIEVKEVNTKNIAFNILEEGKNILNKIDKNDYVMTLEINGKPYSSCEFSKKLDNLITYGKSSIALVIGGSNGLSEEVLKISNEGISFSKMTFPHQLMRVILVEQVYRAFTILNNIEYHK